MAKNGGWDVLKKAVGSIAPVLGTLVGGPAGSTVGALIANALGVANDPSSVAKALQVDPAAAVKLQELENTRILELRRLAITAAQNELAAETNALQTVNATMQAEAKSEHFVQYAWRPFWGFASAIAFSFVAYLVCDLAAEAVASQNMAALTMIPQLTTAMAVLFGIPGAILGVASWHRGVEKRLAISKKKSDTSEAEDE